MKREYLIFGLMLSLVVAAGCNKNTSGPDDTKKEVDYSKITDIKYTEHVQPIFDQSCKGCHNATDKAAGLNLDSWDNMIKGSDQGEALIAYDANNSLMIELMTKLAGGPHPADQGADTLKAAAVEFLTRWINEGARNDAGAAPYEGSTNRLYACNQTSATVSIVDTEAGVVIRNVDLQALGYSATSKPHHVAVDPSGNAWYLTLIGDNMILKLDANTNQVLAEASMEIPALLAVHPTRPLLFVSVFMDFNNPLSSIYALNTADLSGAPGTSAGQVPVQFKIPHGMVMDHAGNFAYSSSLSQNQIIVINTATLEVEDFVYIGASKGPLQLTISPDDQELYVSCQLSGQMVVVDVSDPSSRTVVASVDVGSKPWHPTFTPDGSRVYVGNFGGNTVSVIDPASRSVVATVSGDGLAQPHGIAASRQGRVFVSNRNVAGTYTPRYDLGDNANVGTVVMINTATNAIEKVIEVGDFGSGLSIWEN